MTVSHRDIFLAHLGVSMIEFNRFKMPVHCDNHLDLTRLGRPQFTVLLHYDLYILAKVYDMWSFTSTLSICLDGTVLTHRYSSVGKLVVELAIWSVFNVAESLTNL